MTSGIVSINNETINPDKIGLFYNVENKKAESLAIELKSYLSSKGLYSEILTTSEYKPDITFAVVLGGDGTILRTSRYYAKYDVPIMGINLGRLGFLSQAKASRAKEAFDILIDGSFKIEKRLMLTAMDGQLNALNDIVVQNESFARTSRLYVHINDNIVCDYLADGVIVSTPTGSTAYSLSAGGPVLVPEIDAIVIVPVCPHTMNARPIVIPSSEIVKISSNKGNGSLRIAADGQDYLCPGANTEIKIQKSDNFAKLVILNMEKNSFYSVLQEKLHWGLSWKDGND